MKMWLFVRMGEFYGEGYLCCAIRTLLSVVTLARQPKLVTIEVHRPVYILQCRFIFGVYSMLTFCILLGLLCLEEWLV